mmetsp:Transcript_19797/g.33253  ORF Transcript_19797/g.33253 Transcript_19797/m.33253 type:complete len:201 (+) Transcript_19797:177-779(+)
MGSSVPRRRLFRSRRGLVPFHWSTWRLTPIPIGPQGSSRKKAVADGASMLGSAGVGISRDGIVQLGEVSCGAHHGGVRGDEQRGCGVEVLLVLEDVEADVDDDDGDVVHSQAAVDDVGHRLVNQLPHRLVRRGLPLDDFMHLDGVYHIPQPVRCQHQPPPLARVQPNVGNLGHGHDGVTAPFSGVAVADAARVHHRHPCR